MSGSCSVELLAATGAAWAAAAAETLRALAARHCLPDACGADGTRSRHCDQHRHGPGLAARAGAACWLPGYLERRPAAGLVGHGPVHRLHLYSCGNRGGGQDAIQAPTRSAATITRSAGAGATPGMVCSGERPTAATQAGIFPRQMGAPALPSLRPANDRNSSDGLSPACGRNSRRRSQPSCRGRCLSRAVAGCWCGSRTLDGACTISAQSTATLNVPQRTQ